MAKVDLFDRVCRLCMSSEYLLNLYMHDGDTSLNLKVVSCMNMEIYPGDGFPETICVACKSTIQEFYAFKQKCLEVDIKLRALMKCQVFDQYDRTDRDNALITVAAEYLNENYTFSKYIDNEDTQIIENSYPMQETDLLTQGCETKCELLQCESCGKTFTVKRDLEKHLLSHSSGKRFACKVCSKTFSRSESNEIHMRSHLGIKPFICEICGSSSTKRQDLIRHLRIHSDERHFSCPTCGRKFKRASDLPSHIRTHTGVRPYSCHRCDKTYTSHGGLKKHLKSCCK